MKLPEIPQESSNPPRGARFYRRVGNNSLSLTPDEYSLLSGGEFLENPDLVGTNITVKAGRNGRYRVTFTSRDFRDNALGILDTAEHTDGE